MTAVPSLRGKILNQYSISTLALALAAGLWACGEFLVSAPLLIAATVYTLRLRFVNRVFVDSMKDQWRRLEETDRGESAGEGGAFPLRFFSLSCRGASIFFLALSLLVLLSVSSCFGYLMSAAWIRLAFAAFAVLGAFLAYRCNAESVPTVANLRRKHLPEPPGRWVGAFNRAGVAATVLVLVVTLHALGSMLRHGDCASHPTCEDLKRMLGCITHLHSFAVMSGIFCVHATHQLLSSAGSVRLSSREFPLKSLGLLTFCGSVQTVLTVSVHFPVYAHVCTLDGRLGDVPLGEVAFATGPLVFSIAGGIVAKFSNRGS